MSLGVRRARANDLAVTALLGVGFGFALSQIGFTSWDEVHAMFTFADLRLTLGFAVAVALLSIAWVAMGRVTGARWGPRPIHEGTIVGGVLFGAGWAISGACPSIALAQLGEGQIGALATLAGIFAGNWIYAVVHARWFRWSQSSCSDA